MLVEDISENGAILAARMQNVFVKETLEAEAPVQRVQSAFYILWLLMQIPYLLCTFLYVLKIQQDILITEFL